MSVQCGDGCHPGMQIRTPAMSPWFGPSEDQTSSQHEDKCIFTVMMKLQLLWTSDTFRQKAAAPVSMRGIKTCKAFPEVTQN